jgi:hypothetical protein
MDDGAYRPGIVSKDNMRRAIRLTEYFFRNMNKALKILAPETPVDKLNALHSKLYLKLPETFSTKPLLKQV